MTSTNFQSQKGSSEGTSVDVTVTYLEQCDRPVLPQVPQPKFPVALMRAANPPIHFYRYLYRLVGDSCHWVSRRRMSDDELKSILSDPNVEIYILYVEGSPAGFAEIDRRDGIADEIKFFGLSPDSTGKRLGRYFLTQIIELAWSKSPKKVRLETCTLDHPAALPLYQKLGFEVYDQRKGKVELMDQPKTPH